jgi:hypothetical protein
MMDSLPVYTLHVTSAYIIWRINSSVIVSGVVGSNVVVSGFSVSVGVSVDVSVGMV